MLSSGSFIIFPPKGPSTCRCTIEVKPGGLDSCLKGAQVLLLFADAGAPCCPAGVKPGSLHKLGNTGSSCTWEHRTSLCNECPDLFKGLLAAAPRAISSTLLALHLLLVPLALAIAAGLLILLPGAARRAIEAVLVVGLLAAGRGRKDLSASPAREPILSVPLGVFLLYLILTGFAHNAFHRECHHVGVEVLNGLWLIALIAFQLGDGPAAGKALSVMLLLQLRSWKGILYLG